MILITLFLCDSTAVYGQHFIFATLDYVLHGLQIERGGGGVGWGGGSIFFTERKISSLSSQSYDCTVDGCFFYDHGWAIISIQEVQEENHLK